MVVTVKLEKARKAARTVISDVRMCFSSWGKAALTLPVLLFGAVDVMLTLNFS